MLLSCLLVLSVQMLVACWENHCLAPMFHHLDLQCIGPCIQNSVLLHTKFDDFFQFDDLWMSKADTIPIEWIFQTLFAPFCW